MVRIARLKPHQWASRSFRLSRALRYDNMQKDRTESGMMEGVRQSAVFLLFLTKGVLSREFVQAHPNRQLDPV